MLVKHSYVADESVDYNLIKFLRKSKLTIISVQEEVPSIKDIEVLKLALDNHAVLITEDKDFGELVFKLKLSHSGILLLRTEDMTMELKNDLVLYFLKTYAEELSQNFAVIKNGRLRIRKN